MSTISASTTTTTAYKVTADTTGTLVLQTGSTPTTAVTIGSDQVVTFANQPTYSGGTANGVAYLNGSKVLTTGTGLVFDGTNLGVGITSPSSALYVKRTSGNAGIYADYNGTNIARLEAASNGNLYIGLTTGSGSISIGNTGNANAVVLDSSGNLLINSTSAVTSFTNRKVVRGDGCFSTNASVNVTALNTNFTLFNGYVAGILTIRDNTTGGSALWLIDPNNGSLQISSNLPKTITFNFGGATLNMQQTSGSVTTNYSFNLLTSTTV